ncbi:MAG TPA: hypothetical protein VMW79_10825 [Anaerolineae bacterium]|nr:hypothetical protein [Anaerolineae bacterium]
MSNISRRGFIGFIGACIAGLIRIGKTEAGFQSIVDEMDHPTLPDTLLGFPIEWTDTKFVGSEKIILSPLSCGEAELEAARIARWKAWTSLDLPCNRCGTTMVFSSGNRSGYRFSKLVYKCPDCGWGIEMPILSCEIPQED